MSEQEQTEIDFEEDFEENPSAELLDKDMESMTDDELAAHLAKLRAGAQTPQTTKAIIAEGVGKVISKRKPSAKLDKALANFLENL